MLTWNGLNLAMVRSVQRVLHVWLTEWKPALAKHFKSLFNIDSVFYLCVWINLAPSLQAFVFILLNYGVAYS